MSQPDQARPVCLSIGGSDSCGGAGIQADLRVFEALAVDGCSVITALTAQNPTQVVRIEPTSLAQLDAELHAVFDYYDVTVVKTGMLVDAEHVAVVSALLSHLHHGPLVVDPVMISSSGKPLLDAGGADALLHALLPLATLVTPNFDEAAALFGLQDTENTDALIQLSATLDCAVLLKGGHGEGTKLLDRLCDRDGVIHEYAHPKRAWSATQRHGTGCRLAAAISAYIAHGESLPQAVKKGIHYLQERRTPLRGSQSQE